MGDGQRKATPATIDKPVAEFMTGQNEGLQLPTAGDVRAAAISIAGQAVETPLLTVPALDTIIGGRLFLKAEPLQRTGSFKFRGAYNRVVQLSESARRKGVVAYSSGNHAQAVAASAQLVGAPAVIVMPRDAPTVKIDRTRGHGAEVILYDRLTENREIIGQRIADERDATLIRPYDDFYVIAGQGTVGYEMVRQCEELNCRPDVVVVPASGGGLMAGTAVAVAEAWPDAALYTAEPEGFDDHARSFAAGHRVHVKEAHKSSVCDSLLVPTPGELTFVINASLVTGGVAVADEEVFAAMYTAFAHLKLVVEPGGAVALAAVLSGKVVTAGKEVVVILSGGNVDPATFRTALDNNR